MSEDDLPVLSPLDWRHSMALTNSQLSQSYALSF